MNIETLDDYCKRIKCPHYKKGKDCKIDNCEIRDGEIDDNYYRGE